MSLNIQSISHEYVGTEDIGTSQSRWIGSKMLKHIIVFQLGACFIIIMKNIFKYMLSKL